MSQKRRIMSKIEARIKATTSKAFVQETTKIYHKITSDQTKGFFLNLMRDYVKRHAHTNIDGAVIPKPRTSLGASGSEASPRSMLEGLFQIKNNKDLDFQPKKGEAVRATFSVTLLTDSKENGSPYVRNKKGVNYLEALNVAKKFRKYNGFKEVLHKEFKQKFITQVVAKSGFRF